MTHSTSTRPIWILGILALMGIALIYFDAKRMEANPETVWRGYTMGTTYEIKLAGVQLDKEELERVKQRVEAELQAVNDAMSTYFPDSEISRFNRLPAGGVQPIEFRFREVMQRSIKIFESTEGTFDPTMGVLIDLWGFGAGSGEANQMPVESEIEEGLAKMGFEKIQLTDEGLSKELDGLEINLSAIAKGYGVDRIVKLLQAEGYQNIYMEIGGDLVCKGVNAQNIPWRIGIQVPSEMVGEGALKVMELRDGAVASSGDYRNFRFDGRERQHHILDPRTGHPTRHSLASVSVLAGDCMTADAVATALYVMGTEDGMRWVEQQADIEALFIDRDGDGFSASSTPGFAETVLHLP
jgi:thiamine biosynthesis lipoprotein